MFLLWYIPLLLLAILLAVLVRGRAYKVHPWFFAYAAFGVAADVVRFLTERNISVYRVTYWATETAYWLLGIMVMYEILQRALGNLVRTGWGRLVFPSILLIGLGLSLARAQAVPSALNGYRHYIVVGAIAVRFSEVLIFAGLATLVPILGLRWRQYSFGIATGFGVYGTVSLLATTKFSDFGTRFKFLWDVTQIVSYSIAVLIWIWFFSAPEQNETPGSRLSAPSPSVLEEYKNAMRRMR
jgi:hypothetical protein